MKRGVLLWTGLVVIAVLIVAVMAMAFAFQVGVEGDGDNSTTTSDIGSFEECRAAGGRIAESYPEQCFIGTKSFVNDSQSVEQDASDDSGAVADTDGYIGLTEQAALDRAASQDKPHRVVERDGESLPVTMDYVPGRLNFHVGDGKVERVVVEGES